MKKFISILINVLSAIVAVATLCFIQIHFPQGDIIGVLNSPIYEKTDGFYNLINDRLSSIFTLINLKIPFETNNELNYDKIIAETIDKNGIIKDWTIGECLDIAVSHGIYINTKYNVEKINDSTSLPFDKNSTLNFLVKTYPSTKKIGASTEEEFINEVMESLSKYYKSNDVLNPKTSNFQYRITFSGPLDETPIEYSNTNIQNNELLNQNAFLYVSSKENIITSNITSINSSTIKNMKKNNPYPNKDFTLYSAIDTNFPKIDDFHNQYIAYNQNKEICGMLITTLIISIFIFLFSLIITLYCILSTKKTVDESTSLFYAIPTEIHFLLYILINSLLILFANKLINSNGFSSYDTSYLKLYLYILIFYVTTIFLFTTLATKYATNTLTPLSLQALRAGNDETKDYLPPKILFIFVFIPIILFILLSSYLIYTYTIINRKPILIIALLLLFSTILFVIFLLLLYNAFNRALKDQMKSNEMRTAFIANVSHDIKTPLTSIISYTGLITSELENPSKNFKKNISHYSEIVNDKTNRLNDLINDLIFDSKASTGNVEFEIEKLDLVAFLSQIIIEFKDKLNDNGLKTIFNHDNIDVAFIAADSKQLYRVFQNLFSNIYKYALEKSRVYIDLEFKNLKYIITIKNIQKEKLEVDVDTLKDRFVRGNKSRSTEGFGLGLSISENLIRSMGGKFEISNIRDQFITKIIFVSYEV